MIRYCQARLWQISCILNGKGENEVNYKKRFSKNMLIQERACLLFCAKTFVNFLLILINIILFMFKVVIKFLQQNSVKKD